jgi:hypothetical protein
MLPRLFQSTVSALCYEIAGAHSAGAHSDGNELATPYNDVTRFVLRQHGQMPPVLGSAIQLSTLLFAVMALPRHGALFHRLPPPRRRLQVDAWSISRLAPCRDLMKFYSILAILALYSRPHQAGPLA